MKSDQHFHINVYTQGETLEREICALGFISYPFVHDIIDDRKKGQFMPPFHYMYIAGSGKQTPDWASTVQLLEDDPHFTGYIESEVLPPDYSLKFETKPFRPIVHFPFAPFTKVDIPAGSSKQCDIHVERFVHSSWDALDDLLLDHGFYVGYTPNERVLTTHFSSVRDGQLTFGQLQHYFASVGGIREMYLEVICNFWRKPFDFPVPPAVKKGFFGMP